MELKRFYFLTFLVNSCSLRNKAVPLRRFLEYAVEGGARTLPTGALKTVFKDSGQINCKTQNKL